MAPLINATYARVPKYKIQYRLFEFSVLVLDISFIRLTKVLIKYAFCI